ncbi:hypothetical protein EMPG_16593 [Blastomyces silverae]|uniref:F-box domain-containing protein n=1 Tax=Blastomyces silverae TaxID=2060906 RepID=A0A0H1BFI3_9EURO|nr:hypothetical protein EMPG_16593 [Blastomyces silverae]
MLLQLPPEIFNLVISEINHLRTLKNLSQVSKALHRHLLAFLYHDFKISVKDNDLTQLHIPPFVKTYFKEDGTRDIVNCLSFVRNIELSPTVSLPGHTCFEKLQPHFWAREVPYNGVTAEEHENTIELIGKKALPVLLYIPKDSLQSFSWKLGFCEPSELLGPSGYLSQYQRRITSLSLFDDPICNHFPKSLTFKHFRHLRHLSWKGRVREYHYVPVLDANSDSLVSLELVFVKPCSYSWSYGNHGPGAGYSRFAVVCLPKLRSLSLNNAWLQWGYQNLADAPFLEQLDSLKLLHCRRSLCFLERVIQLNRTMRLKSFELAINDLDDVGQPRPLHRRVIDDFLMSFEGLEELYLWDLIHKHNREPSLVNGILHHKSTLRRLIHHWRGFITLPSSEFWFCEYPLPWHDSADLVFQNTSLECFGFTLMPSVLKQKLEPYAANQRLKLLHLRVSWKATRELLVNLVESRTHQPTRVTLDLPPVNYDQGATDNGEFSDIHNYLRVGCLLAFLQWAFGPTGLPKLKIFVVGELYGESRPHIPFCRRPQDAPWPDASPQPPIMKRYKTFRIMTKADSYLWDEIEGARDMISACADEWWGDFSPSANRFTHAGSVPFPQGVTYQR